MFAVAAYDKNGDLIGGGIGPTSQSLPASHPMPIIMAWTYLTQVNIAFVPMGRIARIQLNGCHSKSIIKNFCMS